MKFYLANPLKNRQLAGVKFRSNSNSNVRTITITYHKGSCCPLRIFLDEYNYNKTGIKHLYYHVVVLDRFLFELSVAKKEPGIFFS